VLNRKGKKMPKTKAQWVTLLRRCVALGLAAVGASLVCAAVALAASGDLTPEGCVDDNDDGTDVCAQSVDGLSAADSIAVSPDGESVYVASAFSDAVVKFNRNTTSGALGGASCIDDNDTGLDFCAQQADGLNRAAGVTVSADGKSVYVTSEEDHAIVHFERKPSGALVPRGCLVDNDFPTESCADSPKGLDGASEVHVSSDGKSVYVASYLDDAIAHFERDTTTGALIPISCIDDNDFIHTHLDCPQSTDGLGQPSDVVVSPDGESVYATSGTFSGGDHAIVHFTRETAP
jgi:DNA-binding beta-propeller fold protein YncE